MSIKICRFMLQQNLPIRAVCLTFCTSGVLSHTLKKAGFRLWFPMTVA